VETTEQRSDWRPFLIGLALWIVATAVTWPSTLTFYDGVGYVGQARNLSQGRLLPGPETPGVWVETPDGYVPRYPLLLPLALTPLFAISPYLVFVVGALAAVALAIVGAVILDRFRGEPFWGLVFLIHPTLALMSRTVMTDLALSVFALSSWWALHRRRRLASIVLFALLVSIKPTGIPIALILVSFEALRFVTRHRRGQLLQEGWPLLAAIVGCAIGGLTVAGLNLMATGTLGYGYSWAHLGRTTFSLEYLPSSGLTHVRSLIAVPPLLIAGLWSLWKRGAGGAALAAVGLVGLSSSYWFVDRAPGLANLIVAPRLILPAVAFLLLGYVDIVGGIAERLGVTRLACWIVVVLAPAVALSLGIVHGQREAPMVRARAAAMHTAEDYPAGPIGVTFPAMKTGMLIPSEILWFGTGDSRPCVVLCNTASESLRNPGSFDCGSEGYDEEIRIDSYTILVERGCKERARR